MRLLLDYLHDRVVGHRALAIHGPFDAIVDVSAPLPAWVADRVPPLDDGEPTAGLDAEREQRIAAPC